MLGTLLGDFRGCNHSLGTCPVFANRCRRTSALFFSSLLKTASAFLRGSTGLLGSEEKEMSRAQPRAMASLEASWSLGTGAWRERPDISLAIKTRVHSEALQVSQTTLNSPPLHSHRYWEWGKCRTVRCVARGLAFNVGH